MMCAGVSADCAVVWLTASVEQHLLFSCGAGGKEGKEFSLS